jgi:hypothetical protein
MIALRDSMSYPDGVLTEGDQCTHTALRDRRSHRFETDTEAGLGRTRFIRVCFMISNCTQAGLLLFIVVTSSHTRRRNRPMTKGINSTWPSDHVLYEAWRFRI